MTTFGDLTHQVRNLLRSYTGLHETTTSVSGSLTASATSFSVADGAALSIGVAEVDDELVYVSGVSGNTVTLAAFGRGYLGSTATTHASGVQIVDKPIFPTVEIKLAIVQCMAAIYPQLYQVKDTTFTLITTQHTYELPADCDRVLRVQYEATGGTGVWPHVRTFDFDENSQEATGKAITLPVQHMEQGRTVKVTYQAAFGTLAASADTLASVGFPEQAVDVLLYGATSKLVRFLDSARLQTHSVENISRSELVRSGDPGRYANQLYAMYLQRLGEERKRLLEANPPQIQWK